MENPIKMSLLTRVRQSFRWRKQKAFRGVYARSGPWARLARHPIPLLVPWRSKELHVRRRAGVGDVLLCTPAIRELKRRNPGCLVHFYTSYPSLLQGLPYVHEIHPWSEAPANSLNLQYEDAVPGEAHLARIIGDGLGLKISDTTPDCAVNATLVESWREAWSSLPRPHILILRRAGNWTPNKNWQDRSWVALTDSLSQFGTIIEVGAVEEKTPSPVGSYVDLRGRTSLEELVAAIAAADLYVGPDSGPMHIAAAVKTPAIVIAGGYIHPRVLEYNGQTYLYTPVPCSPCWLREPCPFDLKCLAAISPKAVERLVREVWAEDPQLAGDAPPRIIEMEK